jgi:type I restriction enzyme S subunit
MMSFKLSIGKLAFAGCDLYTNEAIAAFHLPEQSDVDSEFLYWALKVVDWASLTKGSEKVKGATMNKAKLNLLEIPVPPLEEQKRIVALLDAATERITELTACYEHARTHANNLFTSALRDELESNPDCPVRTLGEICELQRGHDLPTPERRDGNVPILGSTGITGYHDVARYGGPGVAIGRSGFIGGAQYCESPYWPLNTCLFVRDFFGNSPRWVYYFLKSIDFSQYNSGTTQPSLNRNNLSGITLKTPSLDEQKQIVARLDAMRAKTSEMVAAYDAKLTAAKNLHQSILEAAFAGEL